MRQPGEKKFYNPYFKIMFQLAKRLLPYDSQQEIQMLGFGAEIRLNEANNIANNKKNDV